MLDMNKHNIKNTWQILKKTKTIGKQSDKSSFPRSFFRDNESVSNKMQIAESLILILQKLVHVQAKNIPKLKSFFLSYPVCHISYSL